MARNDIRSEYLANELIVATPAAPAWMAASRARRPVARPSLVARLLAAIGF
jgi:hypothetical protein